jgi:hypothetical protein
MKNAFLLLSLAVLPGLAAIAVAADRAVSPPAAAVAAALAPTAIDRSNAVRFESNIPRALIFAIDHGLTVNIVPTQRIDWPPAYQQATEKYSAQVTLDSNSIIRNYRAGLPFPAIDPADPTAGTRIAYNWRFGPFIPEQASIETTQKTVAYKIDPANPTRLVGDNDDRDYRNENDCEQMTFVHYPQMNEAGEQSINYKERGDACGPERGAVIGFEYLEPARDDDAWFFIPAIRKWRQERIRGGYPHQSCTYACVQFAWEYAPPKTEAYSYRLIGMQPVVACLDAKAVGAGVESETASARFSPLNCQVRDAYVVEMRPIDPTSEQILPAKVFVDSETYLYLGAEFVHGTAPDADVPVWSRKTTAGEATTMVLANDFYVPGDKDNFLIALNLTPGSENINASQISEALFNPRAEDFSDGRM